MLRGFERETEVTQWIRLHVESRERYSAGRGKPKRWHEELDIALASSADDGGEQGRDGVVEVGGSIGVGGLLQSLQPITFTLPHPVD